MPEPLSACPCCGQIHRLPEARPDQVLECLRCHGKLARPRAGRRAANRAAAAAFGALLLYWPAILLPFLEIERLGIRHRASILSGTLDMLRHGSWFVGGVVLLFSIVLPLVKILLLLDLSLFGLLHRRHRARTYRLVEYAGKWGMLDVMVLAFLVMLVKLGQVVRFQAGPAVVAFTACVVMSLLASLLFDPRSVWEEETRCRIP